MCSRRTIASANNLYGVLTIQCTGGPNVVGRVLRLRTVIIYTVVEKLGCWTRVWMNHTNSPILHMHQ